MRTGLCFIGYHSRVRILLLILLLANLLFFAWAKWVAPPPAVEGNALPSSRDPGAVRLLRESQVSEDSRAVSDPVAASAAIAGAGCVSAGPYPDQSLADRAAENLGRLGFAVSLRPAVDDVPVGQWLRVGGLATAEDAANALASLQAAGLSDAVMMTDEDGEAVVSLGVFADAGRLAELEERVREAGFSPRSSPRTRKARVFWLDIDTAASAGLPALEDLGSAELPEGTLGLRSCPTASEAEEPSPQPSPANAGEGAEPSTQPSPQPSPARAGEGAEPSPRPSPSGAGEGAEASSRDGGTPEAPGPG